MSGLSRFAEENGGLTYSEANIAYDLVEAERDRCARLAIETALDADRRGAPQYTGVRAALGEQIAARIRSGE